MDEEGDQNIEYHLVTMFEKLENIRTDIVKSSNKSKIPVQVEIRTIEFWRAVISECLSSFIYVFVVCGAASGSGVGASISSVLLATALATGFAMTSLTQCFGHISGAHINPAVSLAMGVIKRISILRTLFFVLAQCGGGIAGAAFLYGVTVPGYQGNLSTTVAQSAGVAPWQRFGIEFMLTFIVVFSYFISMDTYRKWTGTSSLTIGSTYTACTFVSMPSLNPARSLGPSFVLNKWDNHWVYWLGPICGAIASGLIYEYIFNLSRPKKIKDSQDDESSSIRSDDIDTFDEIEKPNPLKFHGSNYNNLRASVGATTSNYCSSLYSAPATKLERGESIYGGTKSLYCNSPPLTRANLNRSQSVYAKSNTGIHNKDLLPRAGPLVPTQSMYPLRLNQHSHVNNQNVQNQLHQRSEGIYGVRGVTPGTANRPETHGTTERQRDNCSTTERQRCENYATTERPRRENQATENPYGTRGAPTNTETTDNKQPRGTRPESMYGVLGSQVRRAQSSVPSDDSCYSSYTANSSSRNAYTNNGTYHSTQKPNPVAYSARTCGSNESKPNQPAQILVNSSNSSSYHHQHSPNPQY